MTLLHALALAAAGLQPVVPAPPVTAAQNDAVTVQMEHVSIRAIGHGAPVVLIPGLATPRAVFEPIARDLARNHRVLLVQVNGFAGDAPRGNAAGGILAGVTGDVARYLDREGLPPAALIGHSMGGVVAMLLARDRPDRVARLMVVDTLPFIGTMFSPDATVASMRPAAEAMRQRIIAAASRQASADDPNVAIMSISPDGRRQVSAWSVAADPRVVAAAMAETMAADLRPDLPAITRVPTTILYAVPPSMAERARTMWTRAYAAAPSVRAVPVENSYHFIMLDQPALFAREVERFLAR